VSFAVWPEAGTDADAQSYVAPTAKHAAEQRARDDYNKGENVWPNTYSARDNKTGTIWTVLVGVVAQPTFVTLDAHEVFMLPASHVLWGGRALCEDLRLRGVPSEWPSGHSWTSLETYAKGVDLPPNHCATCWARAPGILVKIRQIKAICLTCGGPGTVVTPLGTYCTKCDRQVHG
jgi:hypothetical protein